MKFLRSVEGVDIYEADGGLESLHPSDLVVPGRFTAVGVYYLTDKYPRFRTAVSDDFRIDASSAVVQLSDVVTWAAGRKMLDSMILVFVHDGLSDDDFTVFERKHVAIPFMRSHGCDFMAEAVGEFAVD